MRNLTKSDLKSFRQILSLSQKGLKRAMATYLRSRYETVIETPKYIVAVGDIPIALAAHLDTVFSKPPKNIFYDREKNVMWSPEGMGADDRAGVFSICKILQKGLRPHIVFTTDEEIGGLGAMALAKQDRPFKDLRYVIQLDRRNDIDCVFYDCDNPDFTDYVESFGFVEAIGTFSDISTLCPAWGVAGVNLSVGYQNEHQEIEHLYVSSLLDTIDKVEKMLTEDEIPYFQYISAPGFQDWWKYYYDDTYGVGYPMEEDYDDIYAYGCDANVTCCQCGRKFHPTQTIPVMTEDYKIVNYCPDDVYGNVEWCTECGNPYEAKDDVNKTGLCVACRNHKKKNKKKSKVRSLAL